MRTAVRNFAGLAVAVVAATLLLIGVQSQDGRDILSPLGSSAAATWRAFRSVFPGLGFVRSVAGQPLAAAVVGLVLFALSIVVVPATRQGRGLVLLSAVAVAVGFVLYQPSILGFTG